MSAGYVNVTIKDGNAATKTVKFWSSDGTLSGTLTPAHEMLGDDGAALVGAASDAAWDGSAGSPTWTALRKYTAVKTAGLLTALGTTADAKSTATDTTAVSLISLTKEISACLQLLSGALASGALRVRPEDDSGVVADFDVTSSVSVDDTALVSYETVAASQTATVLGGTGATGDYISHILVIPTSTSPGVVTLLDNTTSINVFAGGASSITNLVPFVIPLGLKSVSGPLKITTGANLSVVAVGKFT